MQGQNIHLKLGVTHMNYKAMGSSKGDKNIVDDKDKTFSLHQSCAIST